MTTIAKRNRKPWKPAELASRLNVSPRTIQRRIKDKQIESVRVGPKSTRIPDKVARKIIEEGLPDTAKKSCPAHI